jgi:hypothetical protein
MHISRGFFFLSFGIPKGKKFFSQRKWFTFAPHFKTNAGM